MAINYFGEARMKQLLTLIKGQLDLKATPAQIAQAIEDANLSQYALSVDLTALAEKVGEIPEGYTEETIVAYINKKAEETLNAASGGSSESAASVLAALNTYKAENDPKVKANTEAIAAETTARTEADTALDNRIKAVEDDYLKAADKTELEGKIADAVKAHDESDSVHAALFKALNDKDTALQSEIDGLEAKVGTVPEEKTIVEMIADAQTAATYDDTALAGRVTTVEGKVDTLIGEDANKSARTIASEEVAKIVAGADESYDTLKEISDWISSHATDAASMNSAILALQAIVDGIGDTENGEKATVVAYVTDAIAALNIGDYAKAADLTALAARVTALEGKAHEHENKTVLDGITEAKVTKWDKAVSQSDFDADMYQVRDELEQEAQRAERAESDIKDRVTSLENKSHEHDNKAVLDGITQVMVDAWNAADTEYTEAEVTAMWNSVFAPEV